MVQTVPIICKNNAIQKYEQLNQILISNFDYFYRQIDKIDACDNAQGLNCSKDIIEYKDIEREIKNKPIKNHEHTYHVTPLTNDFFVPKPSTASKQVEKIVTNTEKWKSSHINRKRKIKLSELSHQHPDSCIYTKTDKSATTVIMSKEMYQTGNEQLPQEIYTENRKSWPENTKETKRCRK
jgi:hypothetical protein